MTERDAWRTIAKWWLGPKSDETLYGLCVSVHHLWFAEQIDGVTRVLMRQKLFAILDPELPDLWCQFLAPEGKERNARALLALLFAEGADPR